MSLQPKRRTGNLVDAQIGRQIRAEAKALKLSQKEYLRLTVALSKALRESFGGSTGVSPRQLLTFVESPLFSMLLHSLVESAMSTVNAKTEEAPKVSTQADQPSPAPVVPTQRPYDRVPTVQPQPSPYGHTRPLQVPQVPLFWP